MRVGVGGRERSQGGGEYLGGGRAEAGVGAADGGRACQTTIVLSRDPSFAGARGGSGGGLAADAIEAGDRGGDETVVEGSGAGEVGADIA